MARLGRRTWSGLFLFTSFFFTLKSCKNHATQWLSTSYRHGIAVKVQHLIKVIPCTLDVDLLILLLSIIIPDSDIINEWQENEVRLMWKQLRLKWRETPLSINKSACSLFDLTTINPIHMNHNANQNTSPISTRHFSRQKRVKFCKLVINIRCASLKMSASLYSIV